VQIKVKIQVLTTAACPGSYGLFVSCCALQEQQKQAHAAKQAKIRHEIAA
jgi:hypothetical protein